jgi:hypothetical protein
VNGAENATPNAGRPSDSSPTRIVDAPAGGFALAGPSTHPDPRTHAYRQDLADVALAGVVIASHYAVPMPMTLRKAATLLAEPRLDGERLAELAAGTELRILDKSRGWAWGYAGEQVGYVPAAAVSG